MRVRIFSPVPVERAGEVYDLLSAEWWSSDRTEPDVARSIESSSVSIGMEDEGGKLIGFARAITDSVYKALVLDMVVDKNARRAGHGREIINALMALPGIKGVKHMELYCLPSLIGFYKKFGFEEVAELRLLRKG